MFPLSPNALRARAPTTEKDNEIARRDAAVPRAAPRMGTNRRFAILVSMAFYVASCFLSALMLHTGGYLYAKDLAPS
jgi:hypothetical protein